MKFWMKALVWLGLGGGIGFFAGYRAGYVNGGKESREELAETQKALEQKQNLLDMQGRVFRKEMEEMSTQAKNAIDAIRNYKGIEDASEVFEDEKEEEDPDMPMEEPEMPDDLEEDEEEIQPFHPQDILPFSITRSEFLANEKDYDIVKLDYYTEDCVIFDPAREEVWTHPEQLLGIGWKALFIASDSSPVKEAFIQNDTMETLYQITRIDDSFERLYEEE